MMRFSRSTGPLTLVTAAVSLLMPSRAESQNPAPVPSGTTDTPALVQVLMHDVQSVEEKLLALGEAIPEEDYGWRPGEGVRSVAEVMLHVAADNYFLPTVAGTEAPPATGIRSNDYESVQAYERRQVSKAEALQAMRNSFAHLDAAMEQTDQALLDSTLNVFGSAMSGMQLWVMTTSHLHEHLGQLIAYARSNDVVPPWSQ